MSFLPIVERELRVAARLAATYRNRTLAAALIMLAALVMRMFTALTINSQAGIIIFRTLSFITMVFCILEGVRKTADCLSEEKREGTLGLLFLTDLKGYDVVLGKLVGTSLSSVYGLMAMLPALSLPILVGGVMPGEYWRMVLALTNLLFFSLSAGMLVSACSRHENRAMAGTLLLVLIFMLVPYYLPNPAIAPLSPLYAYHQAFELDYLKDPHGFWHSVGITQAMCWLMLGLASFVLPRWWQDAPVTTGAWWSRKRQRIPGDERQEEKRKEMLATNPALWLASRDFGNRASLWISVAVIVVSGGVSLWKPQALPFEGLLAIAWLLNFVVKVRVASQACHCLAEARRNNALEMLLATPLTVNEIINGQILALRRMFTAPLVVLLLLEALGGFIILTLQTQGRDATPVVFFVVGGMYSLLFVLDVIAVSWAGMWFGLTAKNETKALTKTILLVLVLPCSAILACWFGFVIYIGVPIFWIGWCSSRLRSEFRTIAAQRYAPPPSGSGWLPAPAKPPPEPFFG